MMWTMRRTLLTALAVMATAPALASGQSWREVTMSRRIAGEDQLQVNVEYGAGHFQVRAGEGRQLYRMKLRYDEDRFEPEVDYDRGHLRLGVDHIGRSLQVGDGNGGEMDLELARGVPMNLDLAFGAVRAELDLGGLALLGLDVRTGASESTVAVSEPNPVEMGTASFEVGAADFEARDLGNLNARRIDLDAGVGEITLAFTGEWMQDAHARIKMGLGSLEMRFPEDLGVRIEKNSFLTSFDSEGLVKRGDSYYSLNWEDAERKLSIDLDAAFGSVRVVWVR